MNLKQHNAILEPVKDELLNTQIMLAALLNGNIVRKQKDGFLVLYRPSPRFVEVWDQGRVAVFTSDGEAFKVWQPYGQCEHAYKAMERVSHAATHGSEESRKLRDLLDAMRIEHSRKYSSAAA